MLATQNNDSL